MGRLYDSLKAMDRAVNGWIGYFKNLVWDYIPEPHIREMSPHPTRLRRGVMYMMYSVILLSNICIIVLVPTFDLLSPSPHTFSRK